MAVPMSQLLIAGRFPPPLDGQAIATQHLANMLEDFYSVARINLSYTEGNLLPPKQITQRLALVQRKFQAVKVLMRQYPARPVLYTGLSGTTGGLLRDVYFTHITARADQKIYGIVHVGDYTTIFQHPVKRYLAKLLLRRLSGVICLTEALSAELAACAPTTRIWTIPNAIDVEMLCAPAELARERQLHEKPRLVFVSNMHLTKGFLDVLDAIAILNQQQLPVQADFVGAWSNDSETHFRAKVAELKLESQVQYLGIIHDRVRLKQILLNSDIFVLPTYYPHEALPLGLIEALNAGLPIIATPYRGIKSLLKPDYNGLFVEARNPDDVAQKIATMLATKGLYQRLSRGARQTFEENYHPKIVQKMWLDFVQTEVIPASAT